MAFPGIQTKGTTVSSATQAFSGFQGLSIVNQGTSNNAVLTLARGDRAYQARPIIHAAANGRARVCSGELKCRFN